MDSVEGQLHVPIIGVREGDAQLLGQPLVSRTQALRGLNDFGIVYPGPRRHGRRRDQQELTGQGLLQKRR